MLTISNAGPVCVLCMRVYVCVHVCVCVSVCVCVHINVSQFLPCTGVA